MRKLAEADNKYIYAIPTVFFVTRLISNHDGILKYLELPSTSYFTMPVFEDDFCAAADDDDNDFSCTPISFSVFEIVAADKLPVISRRQRSFSDILWCAASTGRKNKHRNAKLIFQW